MQDRLSALLDCFRLRARVFHTGSLCDTADFDARDGVGHLHVLRGGALRIGDAVAGETVVDAPSLIFYPRPAPHWIRGEGAMGAELVCSSIELGADAGNPLTRSLPARLVLPLRDHPLLHGTLTLLFEEAFAEHCGRQAALDRLSELMILQLLRHCMTAGVVAQGVLAGLADPRLAKALNALHGAPGEAWSLDGLARVSGRSRARFAAHFHHVVGMPPGEYLAECSSGGSRRNRWRWRSAMQVHRRSRAPSPRGMPESRRPPGCRRRAHRPHSERGRRTRPGSGIVPRRHAFRAASGPADRRTRHTGGRARAAGVRLHPRARPAVASSRRPAARIVHRPEGARCSMMSAHRSNAGRNRQAAAARPGRPDGWKMAGKACADAFRADRLPAWDDVCMAVYRRQPSDRASACRSTQESHL